MQSPSKQMLAIPHTCEHQQFALQLPSMFCMTRAQKQANTNMYMQVYRESKGAKWVDTCNCLGVWPSICMTNQSNYRDSPIQSNAWWLINLQGCSNPKQSTRDWGLPIFLEIQCAHLSAPHSTSWPSKVHIKVSKCCQVGSRYKSNILLHEETCI